MHRNAMATGMCNPIKYDGGGVSDEAWQEMLARVSGIDE